MWDAAGSVALSTSMRAVRAARAESEGTVSDCLVPSLCLQLSSSHLDLCVARRQVCCGMEGATFEGANSPVVSGQPYTVCGISLAPALLVCASYW